MHFMPWDLAQASGVRNRSPSAELCVKSDTSRNLPHTVPWQSFCCIVSYDELIEIHLYLVPRLRSGGAILPLLHTSSWHGA
jgi:hypothetical protein